MHFVLWFFYPFLGTRDRAPIAFEILETGMDIWIVTLRYSDG
jgi:hypothetical protein